jgi:aminopeptidase
MQENKLERYADVILEVGLGLQSDQELIILGYLDTAPLVRAITKQAYRHGCRLVNVFWVDEQIRLIRVQNAPEDSFNESSAWLLKSVAKKLARGNAYLQVFGNTPDLMSGQNPVALSQISISAWEAYKPILELQDGSVINWSIASSPTRGWARKVFPEETDEVAVERLWDAIFDLSRVNHDDPVGAWNSHMDDLSARCAYLNEKQYASFNYTAPGTDLKVGLPSNHIWVGGRVNTQSGISYNPNIPTEEIYTLPHREQVTGVVSASRPLSYQGTMIEDIQLDFSAGKVVKASASKGEDVLRGVLKTDQGANRLGEIALVPHSSPVSASGLVYYNSLFDENAANHLALGTAYRYNLSNGESLSSEEFEAAGGNQSDIHIDFMIGSEEMDIDGVLPSGASEPVMRSGEWAFEV